MSPVILTNLFIYLLNSILFSVWPILFLMILLKSLYQYMLIHIVVIKIFYNLLQNKHLIIISNDINISVLQIKHYRFNIHNSLIVSSNRSFLKFLKRSLLEIISFSFCIFNKQYFSRISIQNYTFYVILQKLIYWILLLNLKYVIMYEN